MEITRLISENVSAYKEQFAIDILVGLSADLKSIPSKYFYDDTGSELFQKITKHEDYYLTRAEFETLDGIKHELPKLLNEDEREIDIIELGAGDGHKSQLIINGFLDSKQKVNFYPIDISLEAMKQLEETIVPHKNLTIHGVVADYFEGLKFVRKKSKNRQLVLFLGSNIGNFNRIQTQGFLRKIWLNMNHGDNILIGFDLKKKVSTLIAAYNDSSGLTQDFNLNLLSRINNVLGGNFNCEKFEHLGCYNPILGAMESYLISKTKQVVHISEIQRSFHFEKSEPIHLEYSFKFLKSDIDSLCSSTGFEVLNHYHDSNNYFADSLWRVVKDL